MTVKKLCDRVLAAPGKFLLRARCQKEFGTANIAAAAKRYNRWRYRERQTLHNQAFTQERESLLRDNGGNPAELPRLRLQDGWVRDDSHTLPHLDRVLEEMDAVIERNGGKPQGPTQQPFLRNLVPADEARQFRSVLDFLTSSEMLATVMDHLGTIPVLSKTRPPGIRIMQSNRAMDPFADGPYRESQLNHLDIHDSPLVYVLVALRDITDQCGPWTFLPKSVSARAAKDLNYLKRGVAYRVQDEDMNRVIKPEEQVTFTAKKGDVLFIDSSACFHFGSREAVVPRYQLMCGFTSPCRSDFSMAFMPPEHYPLPENPSRLQQLVLGDW